MTVTFYRAAFCDCHKCRWIAEIYWDKNRQGEILAAICKEIGPSYCDYPSWSSSVNYGGPEAIKELRLRIMEESRKNDWTLLEEAETQYSPPARFVSITKKENN